MKKFLPAAAAGAYIASFAIWQTPVGNLATGLRSGWGDMFIHIRAVLFFAEQKGIPQESFLLAGESVGYAYAINYISSLLWQMGLPISQAMALPTIVLVFIFLMLFQCLSWHMTKSVRTAIVSALLFMAFGGLSGWFVLQDLTLEEPVGKQLRELPFEITAWHEANMIILNPFSMMLHQRAYLLGLPLFILLLAVMHAYVKTRKRVFLAMLTAGGTLLAFFHPFTWASFLLIAPSWIVWTVLIKTQAYEKKHIVEQAIALGTICAAGFLIVTNLQPNASASVIQPNIGWMAKEEGWLLFWIRNIGLYTALVPIAIYTFWKRHKHLLPVTLAGLTPFIAANIFQFSPWDWDNTKILAPSWIIFAIASAHLIVGWWKQKNRLIASAAVLCIPILTLSGGLELYRIVSYRSQPLIIHTAADMHTGEYIRNQTGPQDIILMAPTFNNPAFVFSGRPSIAAYEGWLWSQGWDSSYRQRLSDIRIMYSGTPQGARLIEQYNISYAVIGPSEVRFGANKQWFDQTYPAWQYNGGYTLYDIKSSRSANR